MFGLGPTELIVILVLALLVLGPQRIPEAASSLGKAIRSFRRATRELRDQIDIDEDVRRPFEDLRSALRDEPGHLPPPSSPLSTAPAVAATTGGEGSSLVQPPAEPVVSQGEDAAADGVTPALSTSASAPNATAQAPDAAGQAAHGAPVLALAPAAAAGVTPSAAGPEAPSQSGSSESR